MFAAAFLLSGAHQLPLRLQDNIVIDASGRALICDFGCACTSSYSLSLAEMTSAPRGTVRYWAPELVNHTGIPAAQSKASDVWAFGMTVYVSWECNFISCYRKLHLRKVAGVDRSKKAFRRAERYTGRPGHLQRRVTHYSF